MQAKLLHEAAGVGDLAAIERLADAGADLGTEYDGGSPLCVALKARKRKAARLLLDRGAPIDPEAARVASRMGVPFVDRFARLRRGEASPELLRSLIIDRDEQLVARAIAAGAPVTGHKALVSAADAKQPRIVAMLIDAGARVDEGLPLRAAVRTHGEWLKEAECVTILLDAGAPIDARDAEGMTALMVACRNGYAAAARVLIEQGADLTVVAPKGGMTALAFAKQRLPDIVLLLEARGAPRRTVREPAPGSVLFIDECDVCTCLADTSKEGYGHLTGDFEELNVREEHPESTTTITFKELRCPLCDSYYQYYQFYDDEDVPTWPPSMEFRLMRRCPATTVEMLSALGRTEHLARFEAHLPARLKRFFKMLLEPATVVDNLLPHLVKAVFDARGSDAFRDASPRVSAVLSQVMTLRGYKTPHTL